MPILEVVAGACYCVVAGACCCIVAGVTLVALNVLVVSMAGCEVSDVVALLEVDCEVAVML